MGESYSTRVHSVNLGQCGEYNYYNADAPLYHCLSHRKDTEKQMKGFKMKRFVLISCFSPQLLPHPLQHLVPLTEQKWDVFY